MSTRNTPLFPMGVVLLPLFLMSQMGDGGGKQKRAIGFFFSSSFFLDPRFILFDTLGCRIGHFICSTYSELVVDIQLNTILFYDLITN
ncbi:hypothetical protein F4775DRAFT_187838 [Biscogniauxia sp. FL1348]|nr:hypothetical protein F4775DRAFT_187838 [Biscogniauxia sp. FL1348]